MKRSADWLYLTWSIFITFLARQRRRYRSRYSFRLIAAFLPDTGKFKVMRVPYPLLLCPRTGRTVDRRSKMRVKGRSLWANYGEIPLWHQEEGEGAFSRVVQFQMRPDPWHTS